MLIPKNTIISGIAYIVPFIAARCSSATPCIDNHDWKRYKTAITAVRGILRVPRSIPKKVLSETPCVYCAAKYIAEKNGIWTRSGRHPIPPSILMPFSFWAAINSVWAANFSSCVVALRIRSLIGSKIGLR